MVGCPSSHQPAGIRHWNLENSSAVVEFLPPYHIVKFYFQTFSGEGAQTPLHFVSGSTLELKQCDGGYTEGTEL